MGDGGRAESLPAGQEASFRDRRALFESDVAAYELGRPGYPEPVYDLLTRVCGLAPGTSVLEIGPGTGQATERLLDLGATVTAVELGSRLAARLGQRFADRDLTVTVGAFEDLAIPAGSVDLVVSATSFHWVPTEVGLQRCADALRPGGWLALWWNVFGDADRPDPFHDALEPILRRMAPALLDAPGAGGPSSDPPPHGLDATARIAEIDSSRRFGTVHHEIVAWTGRHTAAQLRAMFASFSPWLSLPRRERAIVLDAVEDLAQEQFAGVVERPYLTAVYLAPRR